MDGPQAVSLAALARALDIPKSSALLILRLLVSRGYVGRTGAGDYRLSRLPGEMSPDRQAWDTLVRVAAPLIRDGVETIAETGCLAVLTDRLQIAYISKALPRRDIVYDRDVSMHRDACDVASGIVLPGGLSGDRLADHLFSALDDPEQRETVAARVAMAREDGYFVNLQGRIEGAAGVAAPIFDGAGNMVAAVNYCGPKERFASNIDRAIAQIVTTARLVSEELGRRFYRHRNKGRTSDHDKNQARCNCRCDFNNCPDASGSGAGNAPA